MEFETNFVGVQADRDGDDEVDDDEGDEGGHAAGARRKSAVRLHYPVMKLITWNLQWGRGIDGRVDLARVVRTGCATSATST